MARRGLLVWALGLVALRWAPSFVLGRRAVGLSLLSAPAWAEEAPKKKERPPEALRAEGYPGKDMPLNGRWSIVFGKKLNGKPFVLFSPF